MTALAKGLPVTPVPEQLRVTPVRNNMVNHSGLRIYTTLETAFAERVGRQKLQPRPSPPAAAVAFFAGGLVVVCVLGPMLLAIAGTVGHKPPAAGMLTWCGRSVRHAYLLSGRAASRALGLHRKHRQQESGL